MAEVGCHGAASADDQNARTIILKVIGVKRLADWCGVGEATPYQWLSRNGDLEPIPLDYASKVMAKAKAEGLSVSPAVLFPSLAGILG